MRPLVACLLLAVGVSLVSGQPDAVAPAGDIRFVEGFTARAAVTVIADENGVLQIDRSQPILIGSSTTPTDTSPPEPPADPLAQRVSAILKSAPADQATRTAIASLYKTTGQLPLTDPEEVRQATILLTNALPLSAEWKRWNADVAIFAGSLSIGDLKRAWLLIAEGLAK